MVQDSDEKRFHLYLTMLHGGTPVAVSETMELHVNQHPTPRAEAMPSEIAKRLADTRVSDLDGIKHRSRRMLLKRST